MHMMPVIQQFMQTVQTDDTHTHTHTGIIKSTCFIVEKLPNDV